MRLTLSLAKESSHNALERFFPKIKEAARMARRALSLARQKVKWEAFRELFQAGVEGSYNEAIKDWRGFLLPAIDSSHIAASPDAASRECRGAAARASILHGIESSIIADAAIERLAVGERSLAKTHIEALGGVWPDGGDHTRPQASVKRFH